jgi:hypothetical protein
MSDSRPQSRRIRPRGRQKKGHGSYPPVAGNEAERLRSLSVAGASSDVVEAAVERRRRSQ